jgi:patatin-like phospholipase/acyl hydrolase
MDNKPFYILALSGGGFKGLFTASVLADLEGEFGCPIAKKFDLIAGTSIGGIIALALSSEVPAQKIVNLFINEGRTIFKKRACGLIHRSKYSNNGLKKCLDSLFNDRIIGDLKHRTIIPAINYTNGEIKVIKTRHHKDFLIDYKRKIVDVALATSAAPTFFPMPELLDGLYIDGGLVANHPGMFACIEAMKWLKIKPENIYQLHIGTLYKTITSTAKTKSEKTGFLKWNAKLFDLFMSVQEKSTDQNLQFLLNKRYHSINPVIDSAQNKMIGIDKINDNAVSLLKQKAYKEFQNFTGNYFYKMIKNYIAEKFIPVPINEK